ncbi:hypothetical protein LB941_07605 [Ligilactobacillus sp. WILCCON 0076]|uniref:YfhO family protein n=1 Tax=Ligilactobacillus ubinensis TaxID=2876789 RepID=A0A9X2FMS4_9LACO|nr:hypothetical protein [Ligilactobacillus ubinensis]MCP0887198.1 hypothetical protein [Ligilactobacillus ubinensis]
MTKKHIRKWSMMYIILLFIIIAIITTIPAFLGGYFKVTYDGGVHLTRWEAVYQALKHGKLPSMVNFIGFQGISSAYTGLYPWITSLIFILPRFIFSADPVIALFCGFIILNVLTQASAYILMREFTANKLVNLVGVMFYQFSAYHMGVMFARNAMGESIAYAILPMILTGVIRIWRYEKWSWLILGLAMGALINTHILSVLIVCTLIFIVEIIRIVARKFKWYELQSFGLAGITAVLTSLYTITNILTLYLSNKDLNTPGHGLVAVDGWQVLQALFNNSIEDKPAIFNIGLIETGMLLFLVVMMLVRKSGNWRYWTATSFGIFFCTLNWLPLQKSLFINSFFGNIQFLGRMLAFVSLFLAVSVTLFLEENNVLINNKIVVPVLFVPLILMNISATYNYHITKNDDPTRYYISTERQYNKLVNKQATGGDYVVNYSQIKGSIYKLTNVKKISNYDSLSFNFKNTSKTNRKHNFLLIVYKGLNYQVNVNDKKAKVTAPLLKVALKSGMNHIKISLSASLREYITFGVMILSNIAALWILIFKKRSNKLCNKKEFFKKQH